MNKFMLLRAKDRTTLKSCMDRIAKFSISASSIWPDKIFVKTYDEMNVIFVSLINSTTAGFAKDYLREYGDAVFFFDGLPYFPNLRYTDYVGSFFEHQKGRDEESLLENTYGSWIMGWISPGGSFIASDFAGLCPLYSLDTPNFVAVSNRQLLLSVARDGEKVKIDPVAATWLTAQGSHLGSDMLVKGVKQVMPGSAIRVNHLSSDLRLGIRSPRYFTAMADLKHDVSPEEGRLAAQLLSDQMAALSRLPLKDINLDITGGFDSRVVVALAKASPLGDKIKALQTSGKEGSREIEIGAFLAEKFQIPHKANVIQQQTYNIDYILDRIEGQAFRYEGMICPTDGFSPVSPHSTVTFSGSAGEIYRRHVKPHMSIVLESRDDVYRTYAWYQHLMDELGVQQPDLTKQHVDLLRSRALEFYDSGYDPNDISDFFFIRYRVPHWNGVVFSNIRRAVRITPLANYTLAKMAFRKTFKLRISDRYHFEVLSYINPEMSALPFLDTQWSENVQSAAERRGLALAKKPFASSEKKTVKDAIPIGHFMFHESRAKLRSFILDRLQGDALMLFNRDAVERVLDDTSVLPMGVTALKSIASLCSILTMTSNSHKFEVEGDTRIPARAANAEAAALFGTEVSYTQVVNTRVQFELAP